MSITMQFVWGPFHKRCKRRPLASHIVMIVDHGGCECSAAMRDCYKQCVIPVNGRCVNWLHFAIQV